MPRRKGEKANLNSTGHDCPKILEDNEVCGGDVVAVDYPFRQGQRKPAHCADCKHKYVLLRDGGDLVLELA